MVINLLEKEDNVINSFLVKINGKVHKSCRIRVGRRTSNDTLKSLNNPPLLAPGWVVFVYDKISDNQLKLLCNNSNNVIVLVSRNRKQYNEIIERLDELGVAYNNVDNYDIDKKAIVEYVMNNLCISQANAEYLASRQKYYCRGIVNSVGILRVFPKVTRDVIKRYTSVNDNIPLYLIFDYVYKINSCKMSYADSVRLVYQYRFALDRVIFYLIDTSEVYLRVFSYVSDGRLAISNYKEFRENTDDRCISNLTEYQLKKIIENYNNISSEFLFYVIQVLRGISTHSDGIPDLLSLLKSVA